MSLLEVIAIVMSALSVVMLFRRQTGLSIAAVDVLHIARRPLAAAGPGGLTPPCTAGKISR
jgi:hypothetical protein